MKPIPIAALAVTLIAGCATSNSVTRTEAEAVTESTEVPSVEGQRFEVESLGLTFRLPETFDDAEDPDYAFFARSMAPRSLFTIFEESPEITDHDAEPGESLSDPDLGDFDAIVITDAALDGMPVGISSNELLVSNGEQSFSVIMSAPVADLPQLWAVFVVSVDVSSAD